MWGAAAENPKSGLRGGGLDTGSGGFASGCAAELEDPQERAGLQRNMGSRCRREGT